MTIFFFTETFDFFNPCLIPNLSSKEFLLQTGQQKWKSKHEWIQKAEKSIGNEKLKNKYTKYIINKYILKVCRQKLTMITSIRKAQEWNKSLIRYCIIILYLIECLLLFIVWREEQNLKEKELNHFTFLIILRISFMINFATILVH